jgi:putative membrane protein
MGYWSGLCSGFAGNDPIGAIVGWAITIGLVAALVLLVVRLARWRDRNAGGRAAAASTVSGATARDMLQLRYARGEISREQFLQMRDDLF